MFDDLIDKLKSKLPENIREKISKDDESDDDNFEESTSDLDVSKIMNASTGSSEKSFEEEDDLEEDELYEEDDDDDELSEEELKKMKRSRLIKAFVGMVIAFLVLDELLLKEDPAPAAVVTKKRIKRKPRKVIKKKIAKKIVMPDIVKPVTVAKKIVKPIAVSVKDPEQVKVQEAVIQQKVKEIEPIQVTQKNNVDSVDMPFDTETVQGEKMIDDQLSKIVAKVATDERRKSNLIYVAPPEYENLGRGLVYNCLGQHWACVDKIAYTNCDKNQNWNKNNKKKIACVISEIYATEDDCRKIQVHNINTITETKFCD